MIPVPGQGSWRRGVRSLHALLMALVALTLLPVLGLSIWSHFHDRALERAAAVEQAAHAAGMVAQALGQETTSARVFLELLAVNPLVRSCGAKDCSAVLGSFARLAAEYQNLLLVRPDGAVLAAARPVPEGANMAEDQAVAGALQGQSFAVGVSAHGLGGNQGAVVSFAAPVQDERGGILLVLVAQLPVAEASRSFQEADLPEGTTLVLAGQSGRILYRLPDAPRFAGTRLPEEQARLVRRGEEEANGWGIGLDGVERFYVMKRLEICRNEVCYVRVGIPKDSVYAASADKLRRNLLGLAAITVLALFLARLWAVRGLLRPVARLMETVRVLGSGEFSARTGLGQGAGELGELARTLDQMAGDMEHHQAEQEASRKALFESEERLRAIFNASADGLLLLVPDGRVLSMNEAAAKRRNSVPEQLTGQNILDLIPNYVRNGRRARFEDVVRTGEPLRFEEEREGRTYAIRLYPVHNEAGEVVQIASFSRDITERKLSERALLEAKEAAESASQAKSAFLANMSHELRTPLNGLMGMLQLLSDSGDATEQREYLDWARQSARQITDLVNDILDYAALGAGKTEFEHHPFSLGDVLTPLEAKFKSEAQAKGLDFVVRTEGGILCQPLMGDHLRLGQVLRLLLENAVKFTHKGSVTLTAGMTCQEEGSCTMRLSVADTGIGITPEDLPSVFDPFVQAEAPLTKRYSGTGLGLAIVRALVERMGGRVEVESTLGKGSTFSLCLSFQSAPAA